MVQNWLFYRFGITVTQRQIVMVVILAVVGVYAIVLFLTSNAEYEKNIAPDTFVPADQDSGNY